LQQPATALQKTAMAVDSAGIPMTMSESILLALQNLELEKKKADAKSVIQPQGLRIHQVPGIPPQSQPYTVGSDTFVPRGTAALRIR
jgi:hypothetical protein